MEQGIPLQDLAERIGCELIGDGAARVRAVAPLTTGTPGAVSFLSDSRLRQELATTRATAVILRRRDAEGLHTAALLSDHPHLAFARAAQVLHPEPAHPAGAQPGSHVAADAVLEETAHVAPGAVVAAGARVGARSVIEANAVVGEGSRVGADCRIRACAVIYPGAVIGDRVIIHGGAVVGADGFGYARDGERWEKVPQIGRVVIGDDVEIGANATVDRGALEDTVIEDGVKIDNLVQVAHNCRIGAHSAMAGCSAVAGSTRLGRGVSVAGGAGIAGHLEIADGSVLTAMARITHDIREADAYASGTPMAPARQWRRNAARFNQLDSMARRLRELERRLENAESQQRKNHD
ncbi:UDP-3-O-(3-hydroxymyristoyl)glucosamine N-acyltransferase [Arhodomonas sp. SL1]|uniref:UDP-3-O-(3-hydroxymyristoyl)glucosamine N-acyltransferase n=1 Tax=Arhodomonas sp. SL1 TaxID=3425691 RepID=UPI003F8844CB